MRRLYLLGLIALLLLSACRGGADDEASTPSPSQSEVQTVASTRAVRTVVATEDTLSATKTASVSIEPKQESRVAAGTNGRVERILKREGERVSAGEAVIALDDDNLQLQVKNAQLALDSARINLERSTRSASENTGQVSIQLRTSQTNFDLAQRQYEEGQALFQAGGISSTELSGLEAQLSQAEAALLQTQDALARSQRSGEEDLALLEVQVTQAETQLAQALDTLAETKVTAPFDGEIADVLVEEGEFVAAGSPAFRLVSTDEQLGRFSVPPQDAQSLLTQGELVFRYQGLDYAARIIRSNSAPGDGRLIDITAEIYESATPIPSGGVAQLRYEVSLGTGIKVPSSAISVERGKTYLFVVENGEASRREVQLVTEVSGQAIVEGLSVGDQIIAPVPADLRSGTPVRVIGAN